MLKKLSVIFILLIGLQSFAKDDVSTTLSKLEDATFGIEYSSEKTENRLNRLEKNIYGKTKTGTVQNRLSAINKDLAGDVIGQEITPSTDTFMDEEDIVQSDGTEKYPILDEIEQKLFMSSNPEKSLRSRIVRIEKKLFSKNFETYDFYTRM